MLWVSPLPLLSATPVAVYCAVPDAIYWALLHWMRWSSRCVHVASAVHETVPGHCLSLKRKSTEWLVRVSITVCLVGTPCYSKRSASKLALTSLRWTLVPSQASFMLAVPARANSSRRCNGISIKAIMCVCLHVYILCRFLANQIAAWNKDGVCFQTPGGTPSFRVSRYVPRFCPPFSAPGRYFCPPPKFDLDYHFIQILLGLISNAPHFQHVDDLFAHIPQLIHAGLKLNRDSKSCQYDMIQFHALVEGHPYFFNIMLSNTNDLVTPFEITTITISCGGLTNSYVWHKGSCYLICRTYLILSVWYNNYWYLIRRTY